MFKITMSLLLALTAFRVEAKIEFAPDIYGRGYIAKFFNYNSDYKVDGHIAIGSDLWTFRNIRAGFFFESQIYMGNSSNAVTFDPHLANYTIDPLIKIEFSVGTAVFELLHECYHFIDHEPLKDVPGRDVYYWNAPAVRFESSSYVQKNTSGLFADSTDISGFSPELFYMAEAAFYLEGDLGMGFNPTVVGYGHDYESHLFFKFGSPIWRTEKASYFIEYLPRFLFTGRGARHRQRIRGGVSFKGDKDQFGVFLEYYIYDDIILRNKEGLALWGIEGIF